jgi:Skp family chaperone for outer membrane proteins
LPLSRRDGAFNARRGVVFDGKHAAAESGRALPLMLDMNRTERAVVYSGLSLCLLLGMANSTFSPPAVATASRAHAADGIKIATIDALSVVERVIASDLYRTPREDNQKAELDKLKPLNDELTKLSEELKTMGEEAASFRPLLKVLEEKNNVFVARRNEAAAKVEAFNTQQVAEAYTRVVDAASAMATSKGYSHLFASKGGSATIASANIPGAVQEMLARPLLKGVAADDLTDALVKEMKLENVVVPANAAPVPTPANAPTPTPTPTPAPASATPPGGM